MSINNPLRDASGAPHPMPVLVHLLTEAIKRLRTVEGRSETKNTPVTLWRGMRNIGELPRASSRRADRGAHVHGGDSRSRQVLGARARCCSS